MSTLAELDTADLDAACRMRWKGRQSNIFWDTTRELCVEGAIRAAKTTLCLWREHEACRTQPGIPILLARWTEDAVFGLIVPLWNRICEQAGDPQEWNSKENCYEWWNGSRIYVRGLKSQDQTLRYSKFRGLTLARVYWDQTEEGAHDVYQELAGRLSAKGFRHQITISPQAVEEGNWIADHFPVDNHFPNRKHYSLSVYDNAHNLSPEYVKSLEQQYPPYHPKHKTLLLGQRGMNVTGEPVYGPSQKKPGAFVRSLHEGQAEYNPALRLEAAIDFGKHHPCVVFRQVSPLGQTRFLGGILGQDLYLAPFIDIVKRHMDNWFPDAQVEWCCDPAGTVDTSQGTEGAYKTLQEKGIVARSVPDSNSPGTRLAAIERMADEMRKRTPDHQECLIVSSSDRWLRVSTSNYVVDRFLCAGFEAGYVWDEHMVSVNNKQVRKPKKDGWFEHGQNCAEYLELNFGHRPKKEKTMVRSLPSMPRGEAGWMA